MNIRAIHKCWAQSAALHHCGPITPPAAPKVIDVQLAEWLTRRIIRSAGFVNRVRQHLWAKVPLVDNFGRQGNCRAILVPMCWRSSFRQRLVGQRFDGSCSADLSAQRANNAKNAQLDQRIACSGASAGDSGGGDRDAMLATSGELDRTIGGPYDRHGR